MVPSIVYVSSPSQMKRQLEKLQAQELEIKLSVNFRSDNNKHKGI